MKDNLKKLMRIFRGSFINSEQELIILPKENVWFRLDNVDSKVDLKRKVISWVSRSTCNASPYSQGWRNLKYHKDVMQKLNEYLDVNFNNIQWNYIYIKLGNDINEELMLEFIASDLDFDIFDKQDYQKLYDLLVNERGREIYD